jgi:hypothetical protein
VYHSFLWPDPAQLRVRDKVAPCLAPVGDEGGEGAAFDAVGDVVDGFADDVVAAADCEGLFPELLAEAEERSKGKGCTMPWPENCESVFRMQYAAE